MKDLKKIISGNEQHPLTYDKRCYLIRNDCLDELKKMPDEIIDLVYADPPFNSNKYYNILFNGEDKEVERIGFMDIWAGGMDSYIAEMEKISKEIHRVLKSTGSFYLHSDHYASHYLKVMVDGIFKKENFQNDIIWAYTTGGVPRGVGFSKKHDSILFYTKNYKEANFNEPYEKSYTPTLPEPHTDSGKKLEVKRDRICQICGKGRPGQKFRIVRMRDVWTNINALFRNNPERIGYPTQKPEKLLERIILTSSNENDLILDPFCGCGTTIAAGCKLNRRCIGIDISNGAISLVKNRLIGVLEDNEIVTTGEPETTEDLKKLQHFDFQDWIISKMQASPSSKKSHDMGIDGYSLFNKYPIQVKQSENVGRAKVDEFVGALERHYESQKTPPKGHIVAFSFTKGAIAESANLKRRVKRPVYIELIEVNKVFEGKFNPAKEIEGDQQKLF